MVLRSLRNSNYGPSPKKVTATTTTTTIFGNNTINNEIDTAKGQPPQLYAAKLMPFICKNKHR